VKTTIDLPADIVRAMKIKAAKENRKLKEVAAELLREGLKPSAYSLKGVSSKRIRFSKAAQDRASDSPDFKERRRG